MNNVSTVKSKIYQFYRPMLSELNIDLEDREIRELILDIIHTSIRQGRVMMADSLKGIIEDKLFHILNVGDKDFDMNRFFFNVRPTKYRQQITKV